MAEPSFALEPGQKWFQVLAEATSVAIAVARDRILYANPACEELTGYSHEELLALDEPMRLIHPDDIEVAKNNGKAPTCRCEMRIMHKDGNARWIQVSIGEVDFEGRPAQLISAVDIHRLKSAEIEQRKIEERLRLVRKDVEPVGNRKANDHQPRDHPGDDVDVEVVLLGVAARDFQPDAAAGAANEYCRGVGRHRGRRQNQTGCDQYGQR